MTEFRLLNGAAPLLIGSGDREVKDLFVSLLDTSPDGNPFLTHSSSSSSASSSSPSSASSSSSLSSSSSSSFTHSFINHSFILTHSSMYSFMNHLPSTTFSYHTTTHHITPPHHIPLSHTPLPSPPPPCRSGGTPLCWHVNAIVAAIAPIAGQLRAAGHRAVLTIFTDGESSDGDVAQSLRPLSGLPVAVVIRLCTDDERVVHYWNAIDKQLEITLDVLDDLVGEAEEVRVHNKVGQLMEDLIISSLFVCIASTYVYYVSSRFVCVNSIHDKKYSY